MNFQNKVVRWVLHLAILVGILTSPAAWGSKSASSILTNGGFEAPNAAKDGPAGWKTTRVPHTAVSVHFAWDDQVFHSGTRSVSLNIDKTHPEEEIAHHWNIPVMNFVPGATYQISAWVKTENVPETPFLVTQCWSAGMKERLHYVSTHHDSPVAGTQDWTRIETTLTIPAKTWRVVILAGLATPDNRGGKVWFDDVKMIRTDTD